ncbi:hypothetical protein LINPERHAP2_LOCUS27535 [Linum perenne]
MRILAWNCRGIGPPLTDSYLTDLIKKYRPSSIFISETRNQRSVLEKKRRASKFPKFWYQDPIGTSRGLALWWVGNIRIDIISCNNFYVDVSINEDKPLFLSCVHAPNDSIEQTCGTTLDPSVRTKRMCGSLWEISMRSVAIMRNAGDPE